MPPESETVTDSRQRKLEVIDVAVGGDVHRIVLNGVRAFPGDSVRAQMNHLQNHADGLRRLLISDPYGADHMCVDLLVEAKRPEAELGFVIMEVMGYPTFSGSNSMAAASVAIEEGLVGCDPSRDRCTATLESPGGLVEVDAQLQRGRVTSITVAGEPAFVLAADQSVEVPGLGRVAYDLLWSGGYYVMVDAVKLGCEVLWSQAGKLTDVAGRIIEAIRAFAPPPHPVYGNVGPPAFLHFMGPLDRQTDGGLRAPAATYGHPGVLWRSPTGTGASARLALMTARGEAGTGSRLAAVSPKGHVFDDTITGLTEVAGIPAVATSVTARPYRIARLDITVDLDDPAVAGLELEGILDAQR